MTDLGAVTDDAVLYASRSCHLIVEANYDPEMLRTGGYPVDLQRRIRGGHGHLANAQTAELILRALTAGEGPVATTDLSFTGEHSGGSFSGAETSLGQKSPRCASAPSDVIAGPFLQDIFLCHLSENNNTPELALATVSAALSAASRFSHPSIPSSGIRLVALPRREPSQIFSW